MPARNYELALKLDGQAVAAHTLRFDATELRQRAGQRGLDPRRLLAQEIRAQVSSAYTVVASEQELVSVAQVLLEQGTNRSRPLAVAQGGAGAETARQLTELQNKLQNALITLQQERVEHRREQERLEDELTATRGSITSVQATLNQLRTQYAQLQQRYDRLKRAEDDLVATQHKLRQLGNERDNLQGVVERFQEDFEQISQQLGEQHVLHQTAVAERDQWYQQAQALSDRLVKHEATIAYSQRLLGLAYTSIIRVQGGRPLELDAELSAAIDHYLKITAF